MELTENESRKLERLIKWSESKSRKILIISLLVLMISIAVGCGVSAAFGNITWKDFGWIVFLFMALAIWVKSVYDLESNLKFVLNIKNG